MCHATNFRPYSELKILPKYDTLNPQLWCDATTSLALLIITLNSQSDHNKLIRLCCVFTLVFYNQFSQKAEISSNFTFFINTHLTNRPTQRLRLTGRIACVLAFSPKTTITSMLRYCYNPRTTKTLVIPQCHLQIYLPLWRAPILFLLWTKVNKRKKVNNPEIGNFSFTYQNGNGNKRPKAKEKTPIPCVPRYKFTFFPSCILSSISCQPRLAVFPTRKYLCNPG